LGHSTIGQMGYMIMECGLGAFALAIFHLIAHGLFKATVFLNCGNVIHAARQEPRQPPARDERDPAVEEEGFSPLTWSAGFLITLILPLIILLTAHGALQTPLIDRQGTVIFLFFSWVTSSQAVLTLYRLRAVSSGKVASLMLLTLLLVVLTYLLAAERFTLFLFPGPGEVDAHFQAAALPTWLFDLLVAGTAFSVILGWVFIYSKDHRRSIRTPKWVTGFQTRLYVLFMNRLYLEAYLFRLGEKARRAGRRLEASPHLRILAGLMALAWVLALILPAADRLSDLSSSTIALFLGAALLLPLFPLHGVYVAALTRLPGYLPALIAVLLPVSGLYVFRAILPQAPASVLAAVRALALIGALYGSITALVQFRVERLLAYGGVSLFSILWWHLATAGNYTPQAAPYAGATALVTGGLFLAWNVVRARYGDLDLNRVGGLARPMPRLGLLLSLLVMAASGLPPFGLFAGFIEILLSPAVPASGEVAAVLLTWLAASWVFLRLMQRLLFGPHRPDISCTDLSRGEVASLLVVLLILLAIGIAPSGLWEATSLTEGHPVAVVLGLWKK